MLSIADFAALLDKAHKNDIHAAIALLASSL